MPILPKSDALTAAEIRWDPEPEPEPKRISAFDLSVELLGDLEVARECLSISLSETHRLTALVARQQKSILTLRTETAVLRAELEETTHALALKAAA